jgi:hypothetical protein
VAEAEAAIAERLWAISQSADHHPEYQAIEDALRALRVLKHELLEHTGPKVRTQPVLGGRKWR